MEQKGEQGEFENGEYFRKNRWRKKKKKRKNNLNTQPYQIISLDIKTQELPPHDIMARC